MPEINNVQLDIKVIIIFDKLNEIMNNVKNEKTWSWKYNLEYGIRDLVKSLMSIFMLEKFNQEDNAHLTPSTHCKLDLVYYFHNSAPPGPIHNQIDEYCCWNE